ncbi:hypothetical protein VSP9026_04007 [Vibrio spartinae]|uniref:Uncharacterized protein n=1 Tax=Vibrio spartinae TaxID=1918945 RepID=A0A1N6M9T1_9VIBR|nr:hypothetical protein VSP9026_04007 [Vibrio spartinae]
MFQELWATIVGEMVAGEVNKFPQNLGLIVLL